MANSFLLLPVAGGLWCLQKFDAAFSHNNGDQDARTCELINYQTQSPMSIHGYRVRIHA